MQVPINILACFSIVLFDSAEQVETSFDDLGKLMLGGISAAIIIAVAVTLVRFRMREQKPPTSGFISISGPEDKKSKLAD